MLIAADVTPELRGDWVNVCLSGDDAIACSSGLFEMIMEARLISETGFGGAEAGLGAKTIGCCDPGIVPRRRPCSIVMCLSEGSSGGMAEAMANALLTSLSSSSPSAGRRVDVFGALTVDLVCSNSKEESCLSWRIEN